MKITQMIEKLNQIKSVHGDLQIIGGEIKGVFIE